MRIRLFLYTLIFCASVAAAAAAQQISAPDPQAGRISGTVTDVNGNTVSGAAVALDGPAPNDHRAATANDNGFFEIPDLKPATTYRVTISAKGFANWVSPAIVVKPGEFMELRSIRLPIAEAVTTVNAIDSPEELAVEQVKVEEKQRVFGVIPNFYVVYDPNPVPLTAKLKFRLALRTTIDPVNILGTAFLAGIDQASDTPDYAQGAKGYGQRFGAGYADGVTDILLGGAILPSLLHQDPRYFYQGTGTKKSRALHALSSPFICKGDNGRWQPNYSSVGGDLASGAISNAYYPESNRGAGLLFENALITTSGRMLNALIQEFVLRKLTPSAKNQK